MNRRSIAIVRIGFLFVALWANAVANEGVIRVKVLDSETRSVTFDDSGVPRNCDGVNYDAYCNNSKTSQLVNTLLVQEGDQPPYRVSCASDAKWSRCMPLLRGVSYDAKHDKRGLIVYYVDDIGKLRKQLYTFVEAKGGDRAQATATTTTTSTSVPASPAPVPPQTGPPAATTTAAPVLPAETPAPRAAAPAAASKEQTLVKCSFSSTPAGAEVTVDGQYVGSTPSVLSLSTGRHDLVVSLPGFAQWKRELTVSSGAELTVNAVLEKGQ